MSTQQFVKLAEFPPDADLAPITAVLQQAAVEHRILPENGVQVLYVDAEARLDEVVALVRKAMAELETRQRLPGVPSMPGLGQQFRATPVMMICLALSVLGAMLVNWRFDWLHWFTYQDFRLQSPTQIGFSSLDDALASGQWWRLITPIFVHFGIFHIAFNGLWLWEFGRRIESLTGSVHFLLLVLAIALVSNYSQYVWSGPSLFGGMSGVLYGLLGYIWIRNMVSPSAELCLPKGIVGFMLIWLAVCMTGAIGFLFGAGIANAAHVSGLVSGILLGALFGFLNRPASH
jgi:rhomboid protease GlpG